jgi:hypothetical protein
LWAVAFGPSFVPVISYGSHKLLIGKGKANFPKFLNAVEKLGRRALPARFGAIATVV